MSEGGKVDIERVIMPLGAPLFLFAKNKSQVFRHRTKRPVHIRTLQVGNVFLKLKDGIALLLKIYRWLGLRYPSQDVYHHSAPFTSDMIVVLIGEKPGSCHSPIELTLNNERRLLGKDKLRFEFNVSL